MLVARATAELCRRQFADVLGGIPAIEEIADGGDDDGVINVVPAAAASATSPATRRRLRRGEATASAPSNEAAKAEPPAETTVGHSERVESARQKAENASGRRPSIEQTEATIAESRVGRVGPVGTPDTKLGSDPADDIAETLGEHREQIAMQCRELDVDRAQVIAAATGGRKASARSLTADEERAVLEILRRIKVGEIELDATDEGSPRLVGRTPVGDDARGTAADPLDQHDAHLRRQDAWTRCAEGLPKLPRDKRTATAKQFGHTSGAGLADFLDSLGDEQLEELAARVDTLLEQEAAADAAGDLG
jgi:hypothetical protein